MLRIKACGQPSDRSRSSLHVQAALHSVRTRPNRGVQQGRVGGSTLCKLGNIPFLFLQHMELPTKKVRFLGLLPLCPVAHGQQSRAIL